MTDRGLPSVDAAQACPFVAFEHDRDERATSPDHRHRCFAEARPAPRAIAHQEAYCLSSAFPVFPTFQDWARREAAHPRGAGIGAATTAAAAAASVPRDTLRGSPGAWPQAPSFAARDSGRSPIEPDDDRDDPGDVDDGEADEDRYDRGAPVFPPRPAEPGSGLAGSRADRVAMAGGAADPAGARPAWPAADDLSTGRGGADDWPTAAGAAGAAGAAAGAAGAAAARDYGRDADVDPEFDDRGRGARDYPHRDERIEPVAAGRKGLFGRQDKRPRVGDTRRDEDDGPAWEQPRRNESYPAVKTGPRMRGLSRVLLAALLLFAAALAVFFLPQLLINRPTTPAVGGASPTASTAAVASASLEPTPVPTPTPFTYTVVPKDTLTRIAKRFGVTVAQILAANPAITDANVLKIGDKLVIPTPGPSGSASAAP